MKTPLFFKVKTASILAVVMTILSFGMGYLLFFKEIPETNETVLNVTIGYLLGTGFTAAMVFMYQKVKEEIKNQQINHNCPTCGKSFK